MHNQLFTEYEDVNAYAVNIYPTKSSNRKISKAHTPASKPEQNLQTIKLLVSFDLTEFKKTKITEESTSTGHYRINDQIQYLNTYDYLSDLQEDRYGITLLTNSKKGSKKDQERLKRRIEEFKDEETTQREKDLQKSLMQKYDVEEDNIEVINFEVIENGIWPDQSEFKYSYEYTLNNLIGRIGSNFKIDVGRLIGQQVALKKKEMQREYNIWMSFARVIKYELTINIPSGYKVKGLENIVYNVSSACPKT